MKANKYSRFCALKKIFASLILLFCCINAFAQRDIFLQLKLTDKQKQVYPDSAYTILKGLLAEAVTEKNVLAQAIALQQVGYILYHNSSYAEALNHYLQADKLFQQTGRKDLIAKNLDNIGTIYYSNRQGNLSNRYFYEALKIYQELNDTAGLGTTYGMIGHICEKAEKYDSAYYYQQLALQYFIDLKSPQGIADIYENIASIYEDKEKNDSSFAYYNKALSYYEGGNDLISQINIRNNLGDIYRKTGRYKEGLEQTRLALKLAIRTKELFQINSAYEDIAKAYHLMGMNDSAYYYNELSRKQVLAIYSKENSKQVAMIQAVYDTQQKNKEIQELENDKRSELIITVATIIIIILLLLLGTSIISRQKIKIEAERKVSEHEKNVYETNYALMQTDLHNKNLIEDNLKNELEIRSRELTSYTLNLIQKNQLLDDLKLKLTELIKDDKRDHKKQIKEVLKQIEQDFNQNKYWDELRVIFEQVHQSFFDNLNAHCNDLTAAELRLASLLKININSSDMSTLLGISQDSLRISRYRLRKKLKLKQGTNLTVFIQNL